MTTEDDFQRQLDAHPDDHDLRRVFADWLQERDDPRAEGYRALGVLERRPIGDRLGCWFAVASRFGKDHYGTLPDDWLHQVEGRPVSCHGEPEMSFTAYSCGGSSRRDEEDKAALAFARLPAERRAELLAVEVLS